jgi:regulator of replication initiation timing
MRRRLTMNEELEELRKEVARPSVEVEMLRAKVSVCLETAARLREELESLRRKTRKPGLREYMETLRAYNEVETSGPEPPWREP